MPYTTGVTATASGLLTAINSFLVSQCNWNLHDTVATGDNVYFSTGSSGMERIYARLRTGIKDYNSSPDNHYWQNQEYPGARFQHINVSTMQHWDASSNTATAEQTGRIGPWLFHYPSSGSDSAFNSVYYAPHKDGVSFPAWQDSHQAFYTHYAFGSSSMHHGGTRHVWQTSNSGGEPLRRFDLVYRNQVDLASLGNNFKPCPGVKPDGTPCIYLIRTQTALTNPWRRRNIDGTGDTALANPPAGGGIAYDNASIVWDGKDYIYINQGEGSTGFYRYTISTDTWSTMATMPAASGTDHTGQCLAYIPKNSSVGVANGWANDRIYYKRATAVNTYYYDVGTNTWSASIGTGSTYSMSGGGSSITWNGGTYIYGTAGNVSTFRALNLGTNVWTAIDSLVTFGSYGDRLIIPDTLHNQITVDTNGSTYWLFGDVDRLIVITKDSVNIYRCYYVGIFDSYYPTQRVTTTGNVSAGTSVNITVSGQFDQFQLGQPLYIVDPSLNGKAQRFTYSSSGVNTIVAGSLNQTYTAGSIIGVDPQPVVMLANEWDAVFPLHTSDGPGAYNATNNNLSMSAMQNLIPTINQLAQSSLPGRRGHYQLWPISIGMWTSATGTNVPYNTLQRISAWNSQIAPIEARGQLIGMYCIKSASAPDPVSEDEIRVGNDTYMVFKCANLFDSTYWNLNIAVGPK